MVQRQIKKDINLFMKILTYFMCILNQILDQKLYYGAKIIITKFHDLNVLLKITLLFAKKVFINLKSY